MEGTFSIFEKLVSIIRASGFIDIVDILLVAFLIYNMLVLVRETRAFQLLKGILVLVLLYAVTSFMQMKALPYIMGKIFTFGAWALLIVFQPELRRALEQVGRSKFSNWAGFKLSQDNNIASGTWAELINSIGDASTYLSKRRIGALMVIEREGKLGDIIKTGTVIDCKPSGEILGNIFFPNSPLHDGALIIRDGRLHAAGCFLPLSQNYEISKEMGTRHRAALGMSEQSDAFIIVVSEETGMITVARDGKLKRGYTKEQLVKELTDTFMPSVDERQDKKFHIKVRQWADKHSQEQSGENK